MNYVMLILGETHKSTARVQMNAYEADGAPLGFHFLLRLASGLVGRRGPWTLGDAVVERSAGAERRGCGGEERRPGVDLRDRVALHVGADRERRLGLGVHIRVDDHVLDQLPHAFERTPEQLLSPLEHHRDALVEQWILLVKSFALLHREILLDRIVVVQYKNVKSHPEAKWVCSTWICEGRYIWQ